MEPEHVRAGWASPAPSRPHFRASTKSKPNTSSQRRYPAAHHTHKRSVSSESHWLRFGKLEEMEGEADATVVAVDSAPRPPSSTSSPRFARSGGCLQLFTVVSSKFRRRGVWSKVLGRGPEGRSEK
ncbi:hypothetical protein TWF694_003291 [Orbilia ellipsospora]|uniref:Uncharacterized protein n=1 Tax=Orbilia ellipsospora TaxID=2528407 RepID=A0AAV9X2F9_9PEZI